MTPPNERTGPPPARRTFGLNRLLPIALLALGLTLIFALGLDDYLSLDTLTENRDWLKARLAQNPAAIAAAFLCLYVALVAFSVPGAVFLTVSGGFLFGAVGGAILSVLGATLGACVVFLAARTAFRDFFQAKAGPALRKLEVGFRKDAFSYLLTLRLVPLFPFWLVNIVPALLGVTLRVFLTATLIGIVPGTFVYALLGSGIDEVIARGDEIDIGILFSPAVLLPLVGLGLLALVPVVYKRFTAGRSDLP